MGVWNANRKAWKGVKERKMKPKKQNTFDLEGTLKPNASTGSIAHVHRYASFTFMRVNCFPIFKRLGEGVLFKTQSNFKTCQTRGFGEVADVPKGDSCAAKQLCKSL